MKTLLSLAAILCLTGCHTVSLEFPNGAKSTVKSVGRQSSFEELSLTPTGALRVKGYNNNEVTGLGLAIDALTSLAAKNPVP